jgi:hypothetical protein
MKFEQERDSYLQGLEKQFAEQMKPEGERKVFDSDSESDEEEEEESESDEEELTTDRT